jgi:Fe-S-cluster-containing hydrogenase component 2
VDEERCIGCKECVLHCPFGAANLHPITKKAFKCDLCGGEALCAEYCPTGAMSYDTVDIRSRATRRGRAEEIYGIAEAK